MRLIPLLLVLMALPFTSLAQPASPPITPDNADQIVELETWGRGLVYDLAWESDAIVAVASQLGVWLYAPASTELVAPRSTFDQPPLLNADGTRVLSRTRGTQIAISPLFGGPALTIATDGDFDDQAVDFSADESLLLGVALDGSGFVWDVNSGDVISSFTAESSVYAAALNPAGTIAATAVTRWNAGTSADQDVIQLWDTATGEAIVELVDGEMTLVNDLEFSPDGTLLAAAATNAIYVWDVEQAELTQRLTSVPFIAPPAGEQPIVVSDFLSWSPDGARLAVGVTDQTYLLTDVREAGLFSGLYLWEVATGEALSAPPPHPGFSGPLAWHSDGDQIAYAGYDGQVRIWSVSEARDLRVYSRDHHGSAGDVLAITPDGSIVTGSFERMLRLWQAGALIAQSAPHTGTIAAIAISPDGTQIASASRFDTVIDVVIDGVIDAADLGEERLRLDRRAADPFALAFDAEGTRLYGVSGISQTLWLWSAGTDWVDAPTETQFAVPTPVRAATLDPAHDRAAVALEDGTVQIYALAQGKLEAEFTLPASATALVYHPADPGLLIAGLADGQLIAYRGADGTFVAQIANAHDNAIFDLAFDPTGALLATASADETIRLWPADLTDVSLPLATLEGHIDAVRDLVWSQDGTRLYSGSWDTTIRVWGLPQE